MGPRPIIASDAGTVPSAAGRPEERKMSGVEEGGGEPSSGSTPDKKVQPAVNRLNSQLQVIEYSTVRLFQVQKIVVVGAADFAQNCAACGLRAGLHPCRRRLMPYFG